MIQSAVSSTRKGPTTTRALRIDPNSPSRLLRSARMDTCRYCGNAIEWCYRTSGSPILFHPAELPVRHVPPQLRWHLASGIAHPTDAGAPWCRIAHPALCPAMPPQPDQPRTTELDHLRRLLAIRTRLLIDRGFQPAPLTPATAADPGSRPDTPSRPVINLLQTHYLAPGPLNTIRCVAQTRSRRRCPNPVEDDTPAGYWTLTPVNVTASRQRHLTPPDMAVYYLSHLPYTEQLRWRAQHCRAHGRSRAADVALTQWEHFDPSCTTVTSAPSCPPSQPTGATMRDSRVVVCGSRRWPWPDTIETVLDRLTVRHGDQLVVIEGAATGADRAAHRWCTRHELPSWRHRCYPVAWASERTRRPHTWHLTGQDRYLQMLLDEEPGLVLAFHEAFDPAANGTAETCLHAIILGIPVWLVPTANPDRGGWLTTPDFQPGRAARYTAQLEVARARRALPS